MLGLSGLVNKFQKSLKVDRKEAIRRVVVFIFLSTGFIAIIVWKVIFSPHRLTPLLAFMVLSFILFVIYSTQGRNVARKHGVRAKDYLKVWF